MKKTIIKLWCLIALSALPVVAWAQATQTWINPNPYPVHLRLDKYIEFGETLVEQSYVTVPAEGSVNVNTSHNVPGPEADMWIEFYVKNPTAVLQGNSYVVGAGMAWEYETTLYPDGTGSYEDYELGVVGIARLDTPDESKTLWLLDDSTLTGDLFREGIDKVVHAGTGAGGAGGSGSGMSAAEFAETKTEMVSDLVNDTYTNPENIAAGTEFLMGQLETATKSETAKGEIESAMALRELPDLGSASASGSGGLLSITFPVASIGTINFDPADNPRVHAVANFMKAAFAWVVYAWFQLWVWNYLKEIYFVLSGSQPAKGNPVVGGTGAQATSLVVALAITGVLVSFPSLFWTLADSGMTWTVGINSNPFELAASSGSYTSTALYVAQQFLPLGTMLAAFTSTIALLRGGLILIAGLQSLIRFFVA